MNEKNTTSKVHSSQINQVIFETTGTILVSLMITCVAISVALFGQKVLPNLKIGYFPIMAFLVSLERMFTYKQIKKIQPFSKRWFLVQFAQWVVLLMVLKLVQLAAQRPESLWTEIQLWRLDFGGYFLNTGYFLTVILIILVWLYSGYFAGLLNEMSLDETLFRFENAVVVPSEHPPARERLLGLIFGLGFLLVILTALMRVDLWSLIRGNITDFGVLPLPYMSEGAWNVLLYFLLGLVLMSLSHLARLNARWRFQKLEVSPQLAGRWFVYSLVFIGVLALAASVLPTHYSLGLLNVLAYILKFGFRILLFIFGVIWAILIFLSNLLASLFGANLQGDESQAPQTFTPPEIPDEIIATGEAPWLVLLKSLLFWGVFLAVVGFSLYQFLRQHEELLASIRQFPVYQWFSRAWHWLRGGIKGLNRRIAAAVETSITRLRSRQAGVARGTTHRFVNLRRLSPRQRVYFFFLAMIRRGGERGFERQVSQTPFEYAAELEDELPDVGEEVASLTAAFVEARYSQGVVDDIQAGLVKRTWERIRGALRSHHR